MANKITIAQIMTMPAISVRPSTSLLEAAKLMDSHHFNGLPVTDDAGILVGIVTEYNLISKGSTLHLPTLQAVLSNLPIFSRDETEFKKEVSGVMAMTVTDVMDTSPLTLLNTSTFEDAVRMFTEHHRVNPIPIIDKNKKVVGVVSRFDVLKPFVMLQQQTKKEGE